MQEIPPGDRWDPFPPPTSDVGAKPNRLTPWWAMLVGITLGVVASLLLDVPEGGGMEGLGGMIGMVSMPGGVSFLATGCLARAAGRPGRRNLVWLALVIVLLPLVVFVASLVGMILGAVVVQTLHLQEAGLGPRVVYVPPVFIGATLGAWVGLRLAMEVGDRRKPMARKMRFEEE